MAWVGLSGFAPAFLTIRVFHERPRLPRRSTTKAGQLPGVLSQLLPSYMLTDPCPST